MRQLPDMDQRAWWSGNITATATALVDRLVRETGRSYTDCILVLLYDNRDLLKQLYEDKREREARAAEMNRETGTEWSPGSPSE